MNYSFWEKYFIESPTDVTVIGSGIVGLSAAISIKELRPELSVKVLERGYLPYGASTKNAGFSCFGSVSELMDDIAHMGVEDTMEVVRMRSLGLDKLKSRVGIQDLEYQHSGGTELFRKTDLALMEKCLDAIPMCNSLMKEHLGKDDCYTFQTQKLLSGFEPICIINAHEGLINPMSMMLSLIRMATAKGITIINGIDVMRIDKDNKYLQTTAGLKVQYKKLLVCTNGFAAALLPKIPVTPARNQVLITSPLPDNPLSSGYHLDKGYIYFRSYRGRILLGGARNIDAINETTTDFGNTPLIQQHLIQVLNTIYPGAESKIEHWWRGILGIGESKYPIIEWVDSDILVGVRLGGMGVAIGSYLGDQLAGKLINNV